MRDKPFPCSNDVYGIPAIRYCIMFMIRYEQKVSASRPSRSSQQRLRFSLARLVARYRVCHLHKPDYLAVSYQADSASLCGYYSIPMSLIAITNDT